MQPTNRKGLRWGIEECYENAFLEGQAGKERQLHSECQEEEVGQR